MTLDLKSIVLESDKGFVTKQNDYWCFYTITPSHYAEIQMKLAVKSYSIDTIKHDFFIPAYGTPSINDITIGLISHD